MPMTYDLTNVICTVGGARMEGFGETDAVTLEWASDIAAETVTADGKVIFSRNNDRRLYVSLALSQKSKSHLILVGFLELQHGDTIGIHPPVILPLPFFLVDPSTGETLASGDCVFLTRPAPSKGKTVGEVVYKMCLPSPKLTPAVANVI